MTADNRRRRIALLGVAILASLAATRTDTLLSQGQSQLEALNGGYHLAFLVGAVFAFLAALIGGLPIRQEQAQHEGAEPLGPRVAVETD
jgi:hypothetical protein